jgi:N4-gp56 family major capsid protein
MAYPRVVGHPDYTRAGASRFIPEVWSGRILEKFYDACVLAAISNTNYEGAIKKYGDTVIIRTLASITIRDYVVGQSLTRERPESTATTLSIDKGKYWAVELDDVMDVQADIPLLDKWTTDASEQMKIAVDTLVLDGVVGQCASANKGNTAGYRSSSYALGASGAPVQVTKSNVLDYIIDMGSVLDEYNVPETSRWIVIPTWMAGLIKKSDLKDASLTGDGTSLLRNGQIGKIDRFTLFSSNLLKTATDGVTCYYALFGHPVALSFASQITETETIRSQDTFADIVRGLNIFGYKVLKTDAIGEFYCRK